MRSASAANTLRAIDTWYADTWFRSRLEARWAVYFDAVGLAWDYEPEGFDVGEIGWYLPDFWLPGVAAWAEVKAAPFTRLELRRCAALVMASGHPCVLLTRAPVAEAYPMLAPPDDGGVHQHDDVFLAVPREDVPEIWNQEVSICDARIDAWDVDERRWFSCCGPGRFPDLEAACRAARGARFEFGAAGAPL